MTGVRDDAEAEGGRGAGVGWGRHKRERRMTAAADLHALCPIEMHVCGLCLSGAGGECHVLGCVFWMLDAPSGALLAWLAQCAPTTDGSVA